MNHSPIARLAVAAGAVLVVAGAQAQVVVIHSPDAAAARAAIQASLDAARKGQSVGMITGEANPQPRKLAGGGVGQELDASTLMFSVARMGADGKVERLCISSAALAEQAVKAPHFAKRFSLRAKE
jgi:hypothetical protein